MELLHCGIKLGWESMNKKETVILTRMEERSKMMFEKIEKIESKLLGNGTDGLCVTVDRHRTYFRLFGIAIITIPPIAAIIVNIIFN